MSEGVRKRKKNEACLEIEAASIDLYATGTRNNTVSKTPIQETYFFRFPYKIALSPPLRLGENSLHISKITIYLQSYNSAESFVCRLTLDQLMRIYSQVHAKMTTIE